MNGRTTHILMILAAAWLGVAGAGDARAADAATSPTISFPAAGEARIIEWPELERLLTHHGAELLVVNFWATWCAPCVAEIPDFVAVSKKYESKGVRFVGLSADFTDSWEETVPPFLKEKKVPYPNFVLDVDPNRFIPRFSEDWSGSLPATFFYNRSGDQLGAVLGKMHREELEEMVKTHLSKVVSKR